MATTRFFPMHINKGKTILQSMKDRFDYGKNPIKTRNGELIVAYECDPETADAEFLLAKGQYKAITGREQKRDANVLCYQIRQAFPPGEIDEETALQISYNLAMRWTKGNHAFFVVSHIDRPHPHCHIYYNSTSLDCARKFRDFRFSARALRRLSDQICVEQGLSVVKERKQKRGKHYGAWLGADKEPSWQAKLRQAIDTALEQKPTGLDEFVQLMVAAGYERKPGKALKFRAPGQKNYTKCDILKGDHTEQAIRERIGGRPPRSAGSALEQGGMVKDGRLNLLIDIQARLQAGKSPGYERWAKVHNVKQAAKTLLYLQENGLDDYKVLEEKAARVTAMFNGLSEKIKAADGRMAGITDLQKHISNYRRTRDVYVQYRKSGYSKKFLAEHEREIALHKAAKQVFDSLPGGSIPSIKALQTEYATVAAEKKKVYSEYRKAREEMRDVLTAKANTDRLLNMAPDRQERAEPQR